MSSATVFFYQDNEDTCQLPGWLNKIKLNKIKPKRAQAKMIARILPLGDLGHEIRRPHADYLDDGIYELRERYKTERYRILLFFAGQKTIVLTHGFVKSSAEVPEAEIKKAKILRELYLADPEKHTYIETISYE